MIFKDGNNLIPIEIKASQTFHPQFLKGLEYFKALTKERCPKGFLIYNGEQEQCVNDFLIYNFRHIGIALNYNH